MEGPVSKQDTAEALTKPSSVQEAEAKEEERADSSDKNSNNNASEAHQQEVNPSTDPLYWLAGGENSSDDDESWDFDGPMILPPTL